MRMHQIIFTSAIILLSISDFAFANLSMKFPDSGETVGLFQQSCIKYAGDTPGLRRWISNHRLPELPPTQAVAFLGSIGPGKVFGASNASGKHVLISYDDGACAVMERSGDQADIQQVMMQLLHSEGATMSPISFKSKPDGSATQALYKVFYGDRTWKISITSKPHKDSPQLLSQITLLATTE